MNNSSVHCENSLLSLINKEADWPIKRKDKVRQDNQTEAIRIKRGRERGQSADAESEMSTQDGTKKRYQAMRQSIDNKYGVNLSIRVD